MTYLKAKLAALGAALLAVLYFFIRFQSVKNQRDVAVIKADTLAARAKQEEVKKKIRKEKEENVVSHRVELLKDLEKSDEEFKGSSNLSNSNDW